MSNSPLPWLADRVASFLPSESAAAATASRFCSYNDQCLTDTVPVALCNGTIFSCHAAPFGQYSCYNVGCCGGCIP